MEDLKEKRLQLRLKRQRRYIRFFFIIGLLLGGLATFSFYNFYWLPTLAATHKTQVENQSKTINNLNKQVTDFQTKLAAQEQLKKEEEERKKPRILFGQENTGQNFPELSQQIEAKLAKDNFIGSVLVIQNDQIVLEKGYGYADKQSERLNQANSEFLIASVQKSMTAVLIMTLVEEGKLTLETPLSTFYPGIPNSDAIIIRDLLDMTSGLFLDGYTKTAKSEEDILNYALKHLTYQPLTKWRYSAVNYILLAGIIQQQTGQSYEKYLTDRLIVPLQLKSTNFYHPDDIGNNFSYASKNNASPYKNPIKIDSTYLFSELGTGNLYSSVGDMFTIFQAMIDGKLILPNSLATLWENTPMPFNYSYAGGFYHQPEGIYGHGIINGYEPTIKLTNDGKTGVITLSNYILPDEQNAKLTSEIFELINTNS